MSTKVGQDTVHQAWDVPATLWAIDLRPPENERFGYAGVFFWEKGAPADWYSLRVALFESRRKAQSHLLEVRTAFPRARVVQVRLGISQVPRS